MSEEHLIQKKINQDNNENKPQRSKILSSNVHGEELEKNNSIINNQYKNEDLGIGEIMLTPLQSILINKKMPFGLKLETEENILKSIDTTNTQTEKSKNSSKDKEKIGRDNNNTGGMAQSKERMINHFDIPNNFPQEIKTVLKKCRKGLDRIKETKYINIYYHSNNPDVPCLANIENKVNNYEYKNLYDFQMDVRNIWRYHFKLQQNIEITSKMSVDWEKICDDLDNQDNEINNLYTKEKPEELQKELYNINEQGKTGNIPTPSKKNNKQHMKLHYRGMTIEEKSRLGNEIRALNKKQLKGIIKILSKNKEYKKSKYFEFDLDKLSIKKLRELEKYVKECLRLNSHNSNNKMENQNNSLAFL